MQENNNKCKQLKGFAGIIYYQFLIWGVYYEVLPNSDWCNSCFSDGSL